MEMHKLWEIIMVGCYIGAVMCLLYNQPILIIVFCTVSFIAFQFALDNLTADYFRYYGMSDDIPNSCWIEKK